MSEQWTDERIAKKAALARVGSYNRTPVGWVRMIEELLTQIRNDMQSQIDALRLQNETLQHQLDELAKLAIRPQSQGQWVPAAGDIEYIWSAQETLIKCPCGVEVFLDEEAVECECGETYRLRHYVEAKAGE